MIDILSMWPVVGYLLMCHKRQIIVLKILLGKLRIILDVIIINGESIFALYALLIKFMKGEHLEEPMGLLHFQIEELLIESTLDTLTSDIDGEKGPIIL